MNNYTIEISQLTASNKYEYIGKMLIQSNATVKQLQNDFDACLDFFDSIMDLLQREQNIELVEAGEYWLDNEVSYEGIIVRQNDNVFTLKVELVEES